MGLFRSVMGLFRSRAGNSREQPTAGLPEEQAGTVKPEPEVPRREVKYEARPNPDKPGWGQTIGQEIRKAREDRSSKE